MAKNRKVSSVEVGNLYCGDSVELLKLVPSRSIDAVVTDPPYNLGQPYDSFDDRVKLNDFTAWVARWAASVKRVLKLDGTFWLFMGDNVASQVDVLLQSMGFRRLSHVVWHYTFGQHNEGNLTPSFTPIFRYGLRRKGQVFNPDAVRVPSARQLVYNDKRANPKGRVPDNVWVLRPQEAPAPLFDPSGTVWFQSRLCGTFKEKRSGSTPNQLPEPLVERILLLTTRPGAVVLDPFVGSGTVAAVAKRLGRRYLGFDLSSRYVETARKRLSAVEAPVAKNTRKSPRKAVSN